MTIDKEKTINIPVWLVSFILPIIVALLASYGVMTSTDATQKAKMEMLEKSVDNLDATKVERNEFNMVIQKLNDIEQKLDKR